MDLVVGKTEVTQDVGFANGGEGIRFTPEQVRVTLKLQPIVAAPTPAEKQPN
jgi:hypothetical protein